jgi:glutathione S-transferase
MVQEVISELTVEVEQRNIWENDSWQNELIAGQGSSTVPVLCRMTAVGETHWLPESNAIIRYLIQTYD